MKQIPLTQGKIALVSDADWPLVRDHKWFALQGLSGIWYAATKPWHGKMQYMHRLILDARRNFVDHRNRNGLDNRRRNLRVASGAQNQGNRSKRKDSTSPYKGVRLRTDCAQWEARIKFHYVEIPLGFYASAEEAATAYAFAALLYFGEFARI